MGQIREFLILRKKTGSLYCSMPCLVEDGGDIFESLDRFDNLETFNHYQDWEDHPDPEQCRAEQGSRWGYLCPVCERVSGHGSGDRELGEGQRFSRGRRHCQRMDCQEVHRLRKHSARHHVPRARLVSSEGVAGPAPEWSAKDRDLEHRHPTPGQRRADLRELGFT